MVFGVCPKTIRDHAPTTEVGNPVFAAIGQSQMGGRPLGSHLLRPHFNHQLQSWSNPRAVTPGLPVSIARASAVAALRGRHNGLPGLSATPADLPRLWPQRIGFIKDWSRMWSASQLLEGRPLFATAAIDANFPAPEEEDLFATVAHLS